MAESVYTFYPTFQEYVTLYRGVIRVWIGDGVSTGNVGQLYAEYIDGLTQNLGPVSSYAIAVSEGYEGTQEEWVEHIAEVSQRALDAEAWATGKRLNVDVSSADDTYHNNAKYYSEVACTHQQGAETAQVYAEQASESAVAAQQSAERAETAAETAKSQAETAQTKAETAQNKAETAHGLAETAKTTAEAANTAAQAAKTATETAKDEAVSAKDRAIQAETNAANSAASAVSAKDSALSASSSASTSATNASTAETNALANSRNAEAWAVGQRGGTNVPTTDPTYHNNSKYYSEYMVQKIAEFGDVVQDGTVVYQNSTNGRDHPTAGTWTATPNPEQGKYTWSKTTFQWGGGQTTVLYNVSYSGVNGDGSVRSVNGMGGDVTLDGTGILIDSSAQDPVSVSNFVESTNGKIQTINTNISGLSSSIATINSDISDLQDEVDSIGTAITDAEIDAMF